MIHYVVSSGRIHDDADMKIGLLITREQMNRPNTVIPEVIRHLSERDASVDVIYPEEQLISFSSIRVRHDLYLLKCHNGLGLSLGGALDAAGATILNPYLSSLTTQNRILATSVLKAAGIPIPPSWFTIDPPLAKAVANRTPLIVKPYARHKTSDVRVINSPKDLEGFSSLADPVLIQKYVKKSPEDLKIYVVGERTFPVRKVYSPDRRDLMGRECTVSEEIREIALKCGKLLRLGLYGVDFIEGQDGPVVIDVNWFPGYRGARNVSSVLADYIYAYGRGRYDLDRPVEAARVSPTTQPERDGMEAPWLG